MSAVLGKDEDGRLWFKSDTHLTDVTEALDFYVTRWWFRLGGWYLMGKFDNDKKTYNTDPDYLYRTLGVYSSLSGASYALEQVMSVRGIREIDPVTGRLRNGEDFPPEAPPTRTRKGKK